MCSKFQPSEICFDRGGVRRTNARGATRGVLFKSVDAFPREAEKLLLTMMHEGRTSVKSDIPPEGVRKTDKAVKDRRMRASNLR